MQLVQFILDKIHSNKTPLSNNGAIPKDEDTSIEETLLQERFDDICLHIKELGEIQSLETEVLSKQLSGYLTQAKQIEDKFRNELEKICLNYINDFFQVHSDCVDVECKLVNKVSPTHKVQINPNAIKDYDLDSMEENEMIKKVIKKRRIINSLIQGSSYQATLSFITNSNNLSHKYIKQIEELDENLPHLYIRIMAINDFLLFTKEEKITDEALHQGSYVSVELGSEGEKTTIKSQAIVFPFLLMETLRGFSELFASHGLPKDNRKMQYVLSKSDYLSAEPWDLRFGVTLFDRVSFNGWNPRLYPFIFKKLCELKVDDFNSIMNELIFETRVGKNFIEEICKEAKTEYIELKSNSRDDVIDTNNDELPLYDSYLASDELSDDLMNEDTEEEIGELTKAANALKDADWDDMFFEKKEEGMGIENVQVIIDNGEEDIYIPYDLLKFKVRRKIVAGVETDEVHLIELSPSLRGNGIVPKVYYAYILSYGSLYSGFGVRVSKKLDGYTQPQDMNIDRVWDKMKNFSNINVELLTLEDGTPVGELAYRE